MTAAPTKTQINLGAGTVTGDEGWLSMDLKDIYRPTFKGDILHIPVRDASVDRLRCEHVLEHLPPIYFVIDWDARQVQTRVSFNDTMNEMWRILKDGGQVEIEVPVFPYPAALADPTHLSFLVVERFIYLDPEKTLMPLIGRDAPTTPYLEMYDLRPWKIISQERKASGSIVRLVMEKRPC
jgi:SAM-dependent methyltransferase